jgi:hypothetical protein
VSGSPRPGLSAYILESCTSLEKRSR